MSPTKSAIFNASISNSSNVSRKVNARSYELLNAFGIKSDRDSEKIVRAIDEYIANSNRLLNNRTMSTISLGLCVLF